MKKLTTYEIYKKTNDQPKSVWNELSIEQKFPY
jgi:hypothetical protein